jgi:beta-lactamase regulating signal transducer with metallopeptidase domain
MASVAIRALDILFPILSAIALSSVTKGAVLFLAGLLLVSLARGLHPAQKARIWVSVLAGTVLFAVFWAVSPAALLGFPTIHAPRFPSAIQTTAPSASHADELPMAPTGPRNSSSPRTAVQASPQRIHFLPLTLASIWLAGVILLLLRFAAGCFSVRALQRRASRSAVLESLAATLRAHSARPREVQVWTSRECAIPFTFGLRNARIIVPAAFPRWAAWKQRAVLLHELEHIRRRDGISNFFAAAACSLLWFVPTAWIARRFLLQEEELACDLRVLAGGIRGPDYAAGIVDLLKGAFGRFVISSPNTSFGRVNMVKGRIRRILSWPHGMATTQPHGGRLIVLLFCLLLPAIALMGADAAPGEPAAKAQNLFAIASSGTADQVAAAVNAGAKVNARAPGAGHTPLMVAAKSNPDPAVIRALIAAGAQVDLRESFNGASALMLAASSNPNPEVTASLLEGGARATERDNGDISPLMYATSNQNPDVIFPLLKAGANINETTTDGVTPLIYAARALTNPRMITVLLDAGANGSLKSKAGNTAFDVASGNPKLVGTDALRQLDKAR